MNGEQILINRYATALMRVCGSRFSSDDMVRVQDAIDFLKLHKQVQYLLVLPNLAEEVKKKMLHNLFAALALPECFRDLVHVISRHKRLGLLPQVLSKIVSLYREQHNIVNFKVSCSEPLESARAETIRHFLADITKKTINIDIAQDTTLIAGVRAQSSDHLWEYSVRKKLRAIRLSVIR